CVACHSLGGIGGAGSNSKNVELISIAVPEKYQAAFRKNPVDPATTLEFSEYSRRATADAIQLHPGVKDGSTVLHTFGDAEQYRAFRESVLRLPPAAKPKKTVGKTVAAANAA